MITNMMHKSRTNALKDKGQAVPLRSVLNGDEHEEHDAQAAGKGLPVLLVGSDSSELTILRQALEAEGVRVDLEPGDDHAPDSGRYPLCILCSAPDAVIPSWLDYVAEGGVLVLSDPSARFAFRLGLEGYRGTGGGGVLVLKGTEKDGPVLIQIPGTIKRYEHARGVVRGVLVEDGAAPGEYPGVVETSLGHGKALIFLFSLATLIAWFHQRRNAPVSAADTGSAERIALSGVKRELLVQPQLALLIGFLTRFIISALCRLDRPIPRLGHLPNGYRNLVTFSFDDFCPSGRPLKLAVSELATYFKTAKGIKGVLAGACRSTGRIFKKIVGYFRSHETQVRCLIDLFNKYGATGS
ncbi:MAG: hypothetical protein JRH07_19640, partial [Deltaproteobacteria bacterium]|nr:hypothetical protein [Deltaproteobacteria bacterium]